MEKFPRNLLLNQYKIDLEKQQNNFNFNCQKEKDMWLKYFILLQTPYHRSQTSDLKFYLNLSKYLNSNFNAFDTLIAENFYKIENFANAKKFMKDSRPRFGF